MDSEKTTQAKRHLAIALMELLEGHPLQSITIGDITNQCHMSRRSFYNYFHDINDLVTYVHGLTEELILPFFPDKPDFVLSLTMFFTYVRKNHLFYERAFRYTGQNSLYQSAYEKTLRLIIRYFSEEDLTAEIVFALQFYCNGFMFSTRQYVLSGMKEEPAVMAQRIFNCFPSCLMKYHLSGYKSEKI